MSNDGRIAINAGTTFVGDKTYGNAGLQYNYNMSLNNPNIGVELTGKANALIGHNWGGNVGAEG